MITDKHVQEFKENMSIFHKSQDDKFKRNLNSSYLAIQNICGPFEIDESVLGKELVFERTRYMNNDQLEFFDDNFSTMINDFGLLNKIMAGGIDESDKLQN